MGLRTVIESSEEVRSPNGLYGASVTSRMTGPKTGLSQAGVSWGMGGTGLVALHAPRVAMGFTWRGDDELVVCYPKELPAPRLEATNRTFGLGGKGRVIYKAVPRPEIPPAIWTRAGSLTLLAEKKLERGVLSSFDVDGQKEHAFSFYDVKEPDSSVEVLRARELQGGGASWAGIVYGLVALREPGLAEKLDLDPEGDGVVVRSANRAALLKVAKLVALAKRDDTLLLAAVDRAKADGEME